MNQQWTGSPGIAPMESELMQRKQRELGQQPPAPAMPAMPPPPPMEAPGMASPAMPAPPAAAMPAPAAAMPSPAAPDPEGDAAMGVARSAWSQALHEGMAAGLDLRTIMNNFNPELFNRFNQQQAPVEAAAPGGMVPPAGMPPTQPGAYGVGPQGSNPLQAEPAFPVAPAGADSRPGRGQSRQNRQSRSGRSRRDNK
jgi:hypothetical protein